MHRRGSGLTLRRLRVLLSWLPPDSPVWVEHEAEKQKATKATPDELKARQAAWERRNAERLAKEAAEHG